jgi:hypothetical protein
VDGQTGGDGGGEPFPDNSLAPCGVAREVGEPSREVFTQFGTSLLGVNIVEIHQAPLRMSHVAQEGELRPRPRANKEPTGRSAVGTRRPGERHKKPLGHLTRVDRLVQSIDHDGRRHGQSSDTVDQLL